MRGVHIGNHVMYMGEVVVSSLQNWPSLIQSIHSFKLLSGLSICVHMTVAV